VCTEESVHRHLTALLERTSQELESNRNKPRDRPEERLRLPFIAAQLADIVERTVRAQYLDILRDMTRPRGTEPTPPATINVEEQSAAEPVSLVLVRSRRGMSEHDLQMWRDAMKLLQQELANQIKARSGRASASALVQAALEALIRRREELRDLFRNFDEHVTPATLTEIDKIGLEVCGRAWPDPPFPETDPDETE
jgi:hypothetical protein